MPPINKGCLVDKSCIMFSLYTHTTWSNMLLNKYQYLCKVKKHLDEARH